MGLRLDVVATSSLLVVLLALERELLRLDVVATSSLLVVLLALEREWV